MGVINEMIAWANQHYRVCRKAVCGQRNRRGGVLAFRFCYHGQGRCAGQLFNHKREMFFARNNRRSSKYAIVRNAFERILKESMLANQRQKWLGQCHSATRPKPRSAAAAKYHGKYLMCHKQPYTNEFPIGKRKIMYDK